MDRTRIAVLPAHAAVLPSSSGSTGGRLRFEGWGGAGIRVDRNRLPHDASCTVQPETDGSVVVDLQTTSEPPADLASRLAAAFAKEN